MANDNRRLDGDWFNGSNFGYYELTGLKVASVKQFFFKEQMMIVTVIRLRMKLKLSKV